MLSTTYRDLTELCVNTANKFSATTVSVIPDQDGTFGSDSSLEASWVLCNGSVSNRSFFSRRSIRFSSAFLFLAVSRIRLATVF